MSRTATGALPLPENGRREQSRADAQRHADTLRCLRNRNSTQCQGRVNVSIFFDGTGNNWNWNGTFISGKTRSTRTQRARNSHSNVCRLWDARNDEPEVGLFSYYIPGVGTPFSEIGDTNTEGSPRGAGAALYGADRINWGIVQIYNSAHQYLTGAKLIPDDQAKTIVGNMSSLIAQLGFVNAARRMILKTWEDRLKQVVNNHQRKLLEINVSVFGFSRGAAQARAFAHWLYEIAKHNNDGCERVLAGVPLRIKFMGVFDTVASVGASAILRVAEGKVAWADGEMMSIHPDVEKCVHFAALHEQRINFPVDLATGGAIKEVLYPGMHSDVGGGYSPGSQGKSMPSWGPSPHLSQIPLVDMHFEAIKAGVPMKTINEIHADADLSAAFTCDARLIGAYNAWLASHGIGGGDRRQQIRAHTRQYLRWRGLRLLREDNRWNRQRFYREADSEDKFDLDQAQRLFAGLAAGLKRDQGYVDKYQQQLDSYMEHAREVRARGGIPNRPPPRRVVSADLLDADTLELLNATYDEALLPQAVIDLFDDYVHDSLAGFYIMLGKTELNFPVLSTNGYLRHRTVFTIGSFHRSPACEVAVVPSGGG